MMKIRHLFTIMVMLTMLLGVGAVGVSADDSSGWISVYDVAACKDSAMVSVDAYGPYKKNKVRAELFFIDSDGHDHRLAKVATADFGVGQTRMLISLPYSHRINAYSTLRLEVQLKGGDGSTYVDIGPEIIIYTSAADVNCSGLCSVTVDIQDAAPANGTVTLRSRFGTWFRPEGALLGAQPVTAGDTALLTFVGVQCNWTVRAWYYPNTGDTTPKMLPSQYWPGEFEATELNVSNPYMTTFASGLPATKPLEQDDPYAVVQ
jgi:hypothetical protein